MFARLSLEGLDRKQMAQAQCSSMFSSARARMLTSARGPTPFWQKAPGHLCHQQRLDFYVSRASACDFSSAASPTGDVVYSVARHLSLWSTGDSTTPRQLLGWAQNPGSQNVHFSCVTEFATGIAACGGNDGSVHVFSFNADGALKAAPTRLGPASWYTFSGCIMIPGPRMSNSP